MIRRPPRSTQGVSSAASDVYKRQMKSYSASFMVDNRPGAGGRLALGALKNSPGDGSVMALAPASNFVVFPHVYKALGYDAFKDFIPVTTVCSFPFLLTVGPLVPDHVRTLSDFVQWCKENPSRRLSVRLPQDRCCISPGYLWLGRRVLNLYICPTAAPAAFRI